jgi:hypothetical protein
VVRKNYLPTEDVFVVDTFTDVDLKQYLASNAFSIPLDICDLRYTHNVSNGRNDGRARVDIEQHRFPDVPRSEHASIYVEFEPDGTAEFFADDQESLDGLTTETTDTEHIVRSKEGEVRIPRSPQVDQLHDVVRSATDGYRTPPKPF